MHLKLLSEFITFPTFFYLFLFLRLRLSLTLILSSFSSLTISHQSSQEDRSIRKTATLVGLGVIVRRCYILWRRISARPLDLGLEGNFPYTPRILRLRPLLPPQG